MRKGKKSKNCNSCRHDLGLMGCRKNNDEFGYMVCNGFELWEGKNDNVDAFDPSEGEETGEDDGFLPTRRKDQIPFMIYLCLGCMLLGAIIYKYALVIFLKR